MLFIWRMLPSSLYIDDLVLKDMQINPVTANCSSNWYSYIWYRRNLFYCPWTSYVSVFVSSSRLISRRILAWQILVKNLKDLT